VQVLHEMKLVSLKRNDEERSKEGNTAGLNMSLPLGASKR
jgi:hypothetical protein